MQKERVKMMDKMRNFFRKADEMKPLQAWFAMIGLAVASLLIVLIPFFIQGKYIVWTASAGDAATQGITFLAHVRDFGWFKAIGDYDFYMGLGADYLTSYSFFSLFDPFNTLFFILPFGDLMNYSITMGCKQVTTALVMFAYLRYKSVSNSRCMILSLAYMLTGFLAFTALRHYNLTAGPIYFPLAILGLEKIFEKKRPYLFIATVFFCLTTNFYVFFSMSVFLVAYAIAYYFHNATMQNEKASVKNFFAKLIPVGCFYLLGVALAAFMLLPNLYGYLNAARSASKGVQLFQPETTFTQLVTLTLPIPGKNYSSMWINMALAALALVAIYKKEKNTRIYAWFVIILTAGFLLPVFGYAMNIFNYSNNRWSYGLSFFVFALIGVQSKNEEGETAYEESLQKKVNITFTVYLCIMAMLGLPALVSYLKLSAWLYIPLILLACSIIYGSYRWIKAQSARPVRKWLEKMYRPNVLFALSLAFTMVYCLGFYSAYSIQHNGKARYGGLFSKEESYISQQLQDEYFRGDTQTATEWYYGFSNRGHNNKYYGTSNYNSITNKYVYEFLKENGVYNPAQNLGISGLDGRYALQSLMSVRYTYDLFGNVYGFEKVDGCDSLYENKNFAGMGFMLQNTYSKQDYLAQDVLTRQYMMLNGIVLEEGQGNADGTFAMDLQREELFAHNDLFKKDKISCTISGANFKGKEVYVVVHGVGETDGLTFVDIHCNDRVKEYYYAPTGNLMYSDQRDFYLNFGVLETEEITVEIHVKKGRNFSFESVELVGAEPVNEATMSAFTSADRLQNTYFDSNTFGGEITAQKDGYMLLALPYSDGWTAYVDGQETDIVRADTAFMAIALTAGAHAVEFRYETPYLKTGTLVSYAALGVLGALVLVDGTLTAIRFIKRKKEKNND